MTAQEKTAILLLRMEGYGIRAVAKQLSCSYQTVSNYIETLKGLSNNPEDFIAFHELNEETTKLICTTLAEKEPTLQSVCKKTKLDEATVKRAVDYIVARKPVPCRNIKFPELERWMRRNCVTLKELSLRTGVTQTTLGMMLSEKKHFSLDVAKKIKKETGLSLQKIFSNHAADMGLSIKNRSPLKEKASDFFAEDKEDFIIDEVLESGSRKLQQASLAEDGYEINSGDAFLREPPQNDSNPPIMLQREKTGIIMPPKKKNRG